MSRNLSKYQSNINSLISKKKKSNNETPKYFNHYLATGNITNIAFNNKYLILAIGINKNENENENENEYINNNSDYYYCNLLLFGLDEDDKNISVISTIRNNIGPYNCIAVNSNVNDLSNIFVYAVSIKNRCIIYECIYDFNIQQWITTEKANFFPTIVNQKNDKKIEYIAFNKNDDIIAICYLDTIFLYTFDINTYTIIKEYIYKPIEEINNINYINFIDSDDKLNTHFLIIGSKSKVIIEKIKIKKFDIIRKFIDKIEPYTIISPGNESQNELLKKTINNINCIEIFIINENNALIALGCDNGAAIYVFDYEFDLINLNVGTNFPNMINFTNKKLNKKTSKISNKESIYKIKDFPDISVKSIGLNYVDNEDNININIVIACNNSTTNFYKIDISGDILYSISYLLNSQFVVIYNTYFINFYNNLVKFWKLNEYENLLINNNSREELIFIPKKIKCNSIKLYDYIMSIDLNKDISFEYEDESGIDAGGMTRIIFDKILNTYIEKYFMKSREDYIIIKDYPDEKIRQHMYSKLWNDTKQLVLLIRNIECKIFLNFDKTLINLLSSFNIQSYFNYFNNNKRKISNNDDFQNIYKSANFFVNFPEDNHDEYILKLNKNFKEIITNFQEGRLTKNDIKKEIRFRKYIIDSMFLSWKHLISMIMFLSDIKKNYPDYFNFNIRFDKKYAKQKIKIIERINSNNDQGFLVVENREITEEISEELKFRYPALAIFNDYLFGPESTDEYRKTFIKWVAGSEYTCNDIKIILTSYEIQFRQRNNGLRVPGPLYNSPSTCNYFVDFYKRPANDNTNIKEMWPVEKINDVILQAIKGNVSNVHVNVNVNNSSNLNVFESNENN
jgi:hypothetical protein